MKQASEAKVSQINPAFKDNYPDSAEKTVAIHLRTVANAFIQAQQRRNDADYNTAKEWTPVEVDTQIASVNEAFKAWNIIRDEAAAQAYLVSLLGARERRPNEPKLINKSRRKKEAPLQASVNDPGGVAVRIGRVWNCFTSAGLPERAVRRRKCRAADMASFDVLPRNGVRRDDDWGSILLRCPRR